MSAQRFQALFAVDSGWLALEASDGCDRLFDVREPGLWRCSIDDHVLDFARRSLPLSIRLRLPRLSHQAELSAILGVDRDDFPPLLLEVVAEPAERSSSVEFRDRPRPAASGPSETGHSA